MKAIMTSLLVSVVALACSTQQDSDLKKDYRDVAVGDYSDAFLHVDDCKGGTFLSFMVSDIYPRILEEADYEQTAKIEGVEAGDGVEFRLSDDVTTYHVAFPQSRQGGRSFGAVGSDPSNMEYVADASYSFYFDSLEKAYSEDKEGLRDFYTALFGILLRCDASGLDVLSTKYKRVAADFVAVYIAEQYRNLVARDGQLKQEDWDNAHLQTTMLASLHSGQTKNIRGMFYEGEFTKDTYDTWDCVYKKDKGDAVARPMRMRDYTQANHDCKRSGVGQTRRDWEKLTQAIADYHSESDELAAFQKAFNTSSQTSIPGERSRTAASHDNPIDYVAALITSLDTKDKFGRRGEAMVEAIVDYLMLVQAEALPLTEELLAE